MESPRCGEVDLAASPRSPRKPVLTKVKSTTGIAAYKAAPRPDEIVKPKKLPDTKPEKKVRPPLPNLPSFSAAASVLGFVGYQSSVKSLLNLLSKNTQKFLLYHRDILRTFVETLTPMLSGEISFGIQSKSYDCMYPETMGALDLEEPILLKTIRIKQFENNKFLSGI